MPLSKPMRFHRRARTLFFYDLHRTKVVLRRQVANTEERSGYFKTVTFRSDNAQWCASKTDGFYLTIFSFLSFSVFSTVGIFQQYTDR